MDIASVLIRHRVLSREQLNAALPHVNGERLDRALVANGVIAEDAVLKAFAEELGMKYVDLKQTGIDKELLLQFPTNAVFRHALLPLSRRGLAADRCEAE